VIQTLAAPIGTWGDRLRMARLNRRLTRGGPEEILRGPDIPTPDFLRGEGFSELMIERFFMPFFSGVCLDPQIKISSRVFQYIFRRKPSGTNSVTGSERSQTGGSSCGSIRSDMHCRASRPRLPTPRLPSASCDRESLCAASTAAYPRFNGP